VTEPREVLVCGAVRESREQRAPKAESQREENREQRAESGEQSAEFRAQRAESRGQKAENREQRAESREQRARRRSKEQKAGRNVLSRTFFGVHDDNSESKNADLRVPDHKMVKRSCQKWFDNLK
jgi:hypothetical protein